MEEPMITVEQIAVLPGCLKNQQASWFSYCGLLDAHLIKFVEECWHLRQPYYMDGIFRIPIPPTYQGKHYFFTNIVKVAKNIHLRICIEDDKYEVVAPPIEIPAKHAELIVASRAVLERESVDMPTTREWHVVTFHATPDKDVPPPPKEIVNNLAKPCGSCYTYKLDDFRESILYWSEHCIAR
jgi:hypothetical protein